MGALELSFKVMQKRKIFLPLTMSFFIFGLALFLLAFFTTGRTGLLIALGINLAGFYFLWKSWIPQQISMMDKYTYAGQDPWGFHHEVAVETSLDPDFEFVLIPQMQPFIALLHLQARRPRVLASEGALRFFTKTEVQLCAQILKVTAEIQSTTRWSMLITLAFLIESLWNIFPKVLRQALSPLKMAMVELRGIIVERFLQTVDRRISSTEPNREKFAQLLWRTQNFGQIGIINENNPTIAQSIIDSAGAVDFLSLFPSSANVEKRIKNLLGYFPL